MKGLIVLTVALFLLVGCDREQVPNRPGSTPMSGAVRPGATCSPTGSLGTAGDGTPMRCSGSGVWRMEVKAS